MEQDRSVRGRARDADRDLAGPVSVEGQVAVRIVVVLEWALAAGGAANVESHRA